MAALIEITKNDRTEYVTIDDVKYFLPDFDEFSTSEQIRIKNIGERLSKLIKKEGLTEKEYAELDKLQNTTFSNISKGIPEEVQAKLLPGQKQKIVNAYFLAYAEELKKQTTPPIENGSPELSRTSSGSMEEGPKTG
ncbi:hypothetical protein LCGC14_0746880 [marine sediment metagenome]|uniref:Uncharacterized protein n=1 Tax=marine sediment metagenome TaxID=412755 RepID=A0A0F9QPZ8_9ZZZZ